MNDGRTNERKHAHGEYQFTLGNGHLIFFFMTGLLMHLLFLNAALPSVKTGHSCML